MEINEVDGRLTVQLEVSLSWHDARLTMYNLKSQDILNTLTVGARESLWIPDVVFSNTQDKMETVNDKKAYMTISRRGGFKREPSTTVENAFVYRGEDNPLRISRVYSSEFLCEFDMSVYPFDSQECQVVFVMKGNEGEFIDLAVDTLRYLGPIDLIQYVVKSYKITEEMLVPPGVQQAVTIRIRFGRRLLSTFLTNYLPMAILCLVAFSTNHFKPFFFEAIVTVNLTALLVLTTLFISISESLPKTNYLKMMDIWCLFNLFVPFAEVLINTYIDGLREDENRTVNHHGRAIRVRGAPGAAAPKQQQPTAAAPKQQQQPTASASRAANAAVYPKELVARDERLEVRSRRDFYQQSLAVIHPRRMRIAKLIAQVGFPLSYLAFVVCYFAVGFGFYYKNGSMV